MPFTLIGFTESQASPALTLYAGIPDEHVRVEGDDIVVPELNQILMALAMSANIRQGQLSSPSLRRIFLQDMIPLLNSGTLPSLQAVDEGGAATFNIYDGLAYNKHIDDPIALEVSEKINALIDNNNNAEQGTVLIWLSDGKPTKASGEIRTLRATIPTTTATYVWSNQALTLQQTLPAGRYAVVGVTLVAANALAGRLVFVGGTWRPGCLAQDSVSDKRPIFFRKGNLGIWGEFEHDQPPTIDILTTAATGAAEIYLDLIQIRAGR